MKTPVLIAARNEEAMIGQCLSMLDPVTCEPIVIANDCSDTTAEVSRIYGAQVIETDIPGKLPAVQLALKHLGERSLDGVLILDADSVPIRPAKWAHRMRSKARDDTPALVSGNLAWRPDTHNLFHSFLITAGSLKNMRTGTRTVYEANLFLRPHNNYALERIIELEHIYPAEGRLLRKTIINCGGVFESSKSIASTVLTSDRFIPKLSERKDSNWYERYKSRAPVGSVLPDLDI